MLFKPSIVLSTRDIPDIVHVCGTIRSDRPFGFHGETRTEADKPGRMPLENFGRNQR
jgi:hypothetical protein